MVCYVIQLLVTLITVKSKQCSQDTELLAEKEQTPKMVNNH